MSDKLIEYFAREAREYLDHLDEMLRSAGAPDASELLRLARGVRGSAQMALADGIALAAEKLEDAAGSLVSREIEWSQDLKSLAVATVHDLKELVGALSRWGPAEDERAREARNRWGGSASNPSIPGAMETVAIESLFFDDEGPHIIAPAPDDTAGASADVVPIGQLLFRGRAALEEALTLRARMDSLVRTAGPDSGDFGELIEELFDLVRLGMDRDTPSA